MPIINRTAILTTGSDEVALLAFGPHQVVQNFGAITTTNALAHGVVAVGDAPKVFNRDDIHLTGDGASGIVTYGAQSHVENFGDIRVDGTFFDPDAAPFDGDEAFVSGILSVGAGYDVANAGRITVNGDYADAIDAYGDGGVVTNRAAIELNASANWGVAAIGSDNRVSNSGSIVASGPHFSVIGMGLSGSREIGTNTGVISFSGGFYSAGMAAFGESQTLLNRGAVDGAGFQPLAMLVVGDRGRLENHGQVVATGDLAFGMLAEGHGDQVLNRGVVHVAGSSARGIYLQDGSELTNAGAIQAEGLAAMGVSALFGGVTIHNSGEIVRKGPFGAGVMGGFVARASAGGVAIPSDDSLLDNSGRISATGDGAVGAAFTGDHTRIVNSGTIEASGGVAVAPDGGVYSAAGVALLGDDGLITNLRNGRIVSANVNSAAVELNEQQGLSVAAATSHVVLQNYGTIRAPGVAVLGGAGSEDVFNFGDISGSIALGGGHDRYEAEAGGRLTGNLSLGGGDDLVVLHRGFGHLVIADFGLTQGDNDVIDLSDFGLKSFASLLSHAHQVGSDVVLSLRATDDVVLQGVSLGALSAGDFIFG